MRAKGVMMVGVVIASAFACASRVEPPSTATVAPVIAPTEEAPPRLVVFARTTLPRKPGLNTDSTWQSAVLNIEPGLLLISSVTRPRVEVRRGPGVQHNLMDHVLVKGQQVAVFERADGWFKVALIPTGEVGFVHSQTISEPESSRQRHTLPVSSLSRLTVARRIRVSFDVEREQRLPVDVPPGAMFWMLKRSKWRALVWLPETSSAVWLDRTNIQ